MSVLTYECNFTNCNRDQRSCQGGEARRAGGVGVFTVGDQGIKMEVVEGGERVDIRRKGMYGVKDSGSAIVFFQRREVLMTKSRDYMLGKNQWGLVVMRNMLGKDHHHLSGARLLLWRCKARDHQRLYALRDMTKELLFD
ncbi:hypothetical protein E2C01_034158 [Portunus trituberculatus]|uniref:Uncharacterized protein n=1 Tax=Portunus trituberculatus TaxID=210409 RepID=A0A5B7F5E2_PORTR|nr:hypothetical protein [Portunus trituberculatus]